LQNFCKPDKILKQYIFAQYPQSAKRSWRKGLKMIRNFTLLETDILPRIKEQIEELRRRLQQIGKEEKLKYVDRKIEAISGKL
jgi:hypothetical protein